MLAQPVARPHAGARAASARRQQEYEPIWPPTLMMNKATRDDDRAPDDHLGRGAARDRPGRARRGRRRADRGDAAICSCSSPSGSIPRADDETAVRVANRAAVRKAIGICVEGRDPAAAARARRASATRCTNPFYSGELMRITRDRDAPLRVPARPAVPCRLGSRAARRTRTRPSSLVHTDDGLTGYASGDAPARPRAARAPARRASIRSAPRSCARSARRSTSTAAGRGRSRWRSGISSARRSAQPLWQLLGGRNERLLAYASSGELRRARRSARARCVALRDAGVRAVKIRFHHADWRDDVEVVAGRARRGRDRTARSWSTRTRAGACPATARRAGTSRPRRSARARSSRSASTGWRSRCAPTTSTATRRCGSCTVAAARGRRDGAARRPRRATWSSAAASTCCSPTSSSRWRDRRLPPHRGARRPARPAWSPHTWSNGYGLVGEPARARSRSRPCRTSRCRSTRRRGRPSAATGCCRRRSRSPPTARSRRRPGRASASSPTSTRSSAGRVGMMRIQRRPCSTSPAARRVEEVLLDPPRRDEVLVRVAAAGVCHSDLHLADGELGDGRWPMVLGHEGAGVVEAVGEGVTHVAPGDARRVLLRARVRCCRPAAPDGPTCASRRASTAAPGC